MQEKQNKNSLNLLGFNMLRHGDVICNCKTTGFDVDDVILNVLGICIGYFIFPFFEKVFVMKRVSVELE